jgi:hypothetical protein
VCDLAWCKTEVKLYWHRRHWISSCKFTLRNSSTSIPIGRPGLISRFLSTIPYPVSSVNSHRVQGIKLTDHTPHLVSSVRMGRFAPSSVLLHGVAFDCADKFTHRLQRVNTVPEPVNFVTIAFFFWHLRLCNCCLQSYMAISFPMKAYSLSWQHKISCVLFQSFLNVGRHWYSSWEPVWTTSRQLSASVCAYPPTQSEYSLFTNFLRSTLVALKTENDDGLL